jgi:porin
MKLRRSINVLICRWRTFVSRAVLGFIAATAWAEPAEIPKEKTPPLAAWLSADGITGDWGGLRSELAGCGIVFLGSEQVELWGNTTGGLERGTVYTGLLTFGLNLDLDKAVGWCGASVGTTWLWLSGRDASQDLAGNFLTISGIAGFNTVRMFELWFQQNLLNDKISLRFGQLTADTEFIISRYGGTFINGTFGWPAFMYMNLPGGGPQFPTGTLGVRLAVNPLDWFKFQTAIFQGNVYAQNVNLHGFAWRLNSQNGLFFLNEAQFLWNQSEKQMGLPGEFKAGAWVDTAKFANPNDDNLVRGNYGFYFILDQMLYCKPAESAGNRCDQGLGWFGRIGYEPQYHDFVGFYFDTGLTYKGLITTRGDDTFGVAFAYARLSSGARQAAIKDGSVGVGAEMVLEATYQAQINKWLSIQPDLQFIINPGGNQDLGNAVVIGGRVSITF